MSLSLSQPMVRTEVVSCAVAAHAALRVPRQRFAALRRNPGKPVKGPFTPSFLKHAEEQTVAGLAAVLEAVHEHGLAGAAFADWGVIAGPCFMGRRATVEALSRFLAEGAFGISPHLIPHESMHAVSGTVSQALGIHGPNFGVGGSPSAVEETLLTAATLLRHGHLAGLWVVLTDFEPELIPDPPDQRECECLALALGLRRYDGSGWRLDLEPAETARPSGRHLRLSTLAQSFSRPTMTEMRWELSSGGWLWLRSPDMMTPSSPALTARPSMIPTLAPGGERM